MRWSFGCRFGKTRRDLSSPTSAGRDGGHGGRNLHTHPEEIQKTQAHLLTRPKDHAAGSESPPRACEPNHRLDVFPIPPDSKKPKLTPVICLTDFGPWPISPTWILSRRISRQMHANFPLNRLSSRSRYALQGMVHLARRPEGGFCLVEEVARKQQLPANFLSKIFQGLARRGVLVPRRGPGGGYALASAARKMSLAEIVTSTEEASPQGRHCLLGFGGCSGNRRCSIHDAATRANNMLWRALRQTTLLDLEGSVRRHY